VTHTSVVNLKRGERCDVYMGRASSAWRARPLLDPGARWNGLDGFYGNPFPAMHGRGSALGHFLPWFHRKVATDPVYLERVLSLRGLRLACFCAPLPCHARIIADWIDAFPEDWAWAFLEVVRRQAAARSEVSPRSCSA